MPRAKKNEVVEDNEINEKSKMDLENINPNKKKSKKIDVVLEKPKEDNKKDKKEKPKEKVITEKVMSQKDLMKELKNKEKELNKIKILANKINDLL